MLLRLYQVVYFAKQFGRRQFKQISHWIYVFAARMFWSSSLGRCWSYIIICVLDAWQPWWHPSARTAPGVQKHKTNESENELSLHKGEDLKRSGDENCRRRRRMHIHNKSKCTHTWKCVSAASQLSSDLRRWVLLSRRRSATQGGKFLD